MVGRFEHIDWDVVHDLWKRSGPEKYPITPAQMESHLRGSPTLNYEASRWMTFDRQLVGCLAVKDSPHALYPGPNPLQAHLAFFVFQDFSKASELYGAVEQILRGQGKQRVVFGQDSRHFFPGVPSEWPEMRQFLLDQGFVEGPEQVDVERDMADYVPPAGSLEPIAPPIEARPCRADDLPALRAHLEAEFPGRWQFEVLEKFSLEGPETVFGLFEDGKCHGFALLQQEGCQLAIGGAVWNGDLGPGWGSLGPIGISKEVRGRGLGDALLAAALVELQSRGARRSIIDWTTLIEFYQRHGFQVNRRYATLTKEL